MIDLNKVQFVAPHDEIRTMIYHDIDNHFTFEVSLMATGDNDEDLIISWAAYRRGKTIVYQDTTIFVRDTRE